MEINESFLSLQGDGPLSGRLTYFVRSSGCNLRCEYCDTKYAYDDGEDYSIDTIIKNIVNSGAKNVCITGGEPLMNPDTDSLANALIENGYNVDLETNGSLPLPDWVKNEHVMVAMDIKCPSSGMADRMLFDNIGLLSNKDIVKFVIGSNEDYEYAKKVSELITEAKIYFHPVFGSFEPKELAENIIRDKLDNVVFGLQIHKVIWKPETRGV